MKNKITISNAFPELKEEELQAADRRGETYVFPRDLQAKEDNEAIAYHLEKDKENEE